MFKFMTVEEVANYLRVTEKTIYRLLRQGKIPATKVGNQWRFDTNSIDEWLQRNSVPMKVKRLCLDDKDNPFTI